MRLGAAAAPTAVVFCDIDGTINDERLPEGDRLRSIEPAAGALRELEAAGVHIVLTTARSVPEAREYAREIRLAASVIGEDGAAIEWAPAWALAPCPTLPGVLDRLRKFLRPFVDHAGSDLVASCLPATWRLAPPAARATIQRSRARVGSALLWSASPGLLSRVEREAPSHGLRTFGECVQILSVDVDKGFGVRRWLDDSGVDPRLVFAIGNAANDLSMFREIQRRGGRAFMVASDPSWMGVESTSERGGAGVVEVSRIVRRALSQVRRGSEASEELKFETR